MKILTAEITSLVKNSDNKNWTEIEGLRISVPPGSGFVTLLFNAPYMYYSTPSGSPGVLFRIVYRQGRGTNNPAVVAAGGSTNEKPNDGRIALSLIRSLLHSDAEQGSYSVQWKAVRSATANLQGLDGAPSATLTAILDQD